MCSRGALSTILYFCKFSFFVNLLAISFHQTKTDSKAGNYQVPGSRNPARHCLEPGRIAGQGPKSSIKFGILSCPAVRSSCAETSSISPDFSAGQDTSSNYQLFVSVLPGTSGWILCCAPIHPPFLLIFPSSIHDGIGRGPFSWRDAGGCSIKATRAL